MNGNNKFGAGQDKEALALDMPHAEDAMSFTEIDELRRRCRMSPAVSTSHSSQTCRPKGAMGSARKCRRFNCVHGQGWALDTASLLRS